MKYSLPIWETRCKLWDDELKVYSTVRWYQFAKDFEVFSLIKIHSNHFLLLSEPFCCGQVTKKVLMHLFG